MGVHDDEYDENTDWRAKYLEAADMLAETRAELDDFQHSSKELEEELERELERTERAQEELKSKVVRAETERDDWKTRFMTLQTQHNTTTTSLQRELDQLRQIHQQLKSQMRELEIGNDDLEGRERAVTSSLADFENRYAKVLEEKILLEQELLDKATLEEECQRLKDEARDLGEEVYVLKEQLNEARANAHLAAPSTSSLPPVPSRTSSTSDNLLSMEPPDLLLSELTEVGTTPLEETPISATSTSSAASAAACPSPASSGQTAVLQRAGFVRQNSIPSTSGALSRSSTMPSISPTRLPMRDPARPSPSPRPQIPTYTSTSSTRTNTLNSSTSSTSKSKGVQMVSEMRARVRTLEQKLHTRVPRLRMGSISGRNTSNGLNDSLPKDSTATKEKTVAGKEKERERLKGAESPGWVLIMEENATPQPKSRRSADSGGSRSSTEIRRTGSPADVPTSFRPAQSTYAGSSSASASGGVRRPASRLSASTTDGRSSIGSTISTLSSATTTSRPTTPTFLPIPSSSFRTSTATPSSSGLPGRRTSLGPPAHTPIPPTPRGRERPTSVPFSGRPFANGQAGGSGGLDKSQIGIPRSMSKQLPSLPSMTNLSATRTGSGTSSPNLLSQSRIGRPPSAFTGVRRPAAAMTQDDSAAGVNGTPANLKASTRLRAGSFKS